MKVFEKLHQVKEMIVRLIVCWTIIISKKIAIDLSKKSACWSKSNTGNLTQQAAMFFIVEPAKGTASVFSKGTLKVF